MEKMSSNIKLGLNKKWVREVTVFFLARPDTWSFKFVLDSIPVSCYVVANILYLKHTNCMIK